MLFIIRLIKTYMKMEYPVPRLMYLASSIVIILYIDSNVIMSEYNADGSRCALASKLSSIKREAMAKVMSDKPGLMGGFTSIQSGLGLMWDLYYPKTWYPRSKERDDP
jgi:hypothetical protein